jgi:hypothetical protein
MVDFSKPYERSDVRYEIRPDDGNDLWSSPRCKHCGLTVSYHWQEADGSIWCVRNRMGKGANDG